MHARLGTFVFWFFYWMWYQVFDAIRDDILDHGENEDKINNLNTSDNKATSDVNLKYKTIVYKPQHSDTEFRFHARPVKSKYLVSQDTIGKVLIQNGIVSILFAYWCDFGLPNRPELFEISFPSWMSYESKSIYGTSHIVGDWVFNLMVGIVRFLTTLMLTEVYFYAVHRLFHSLGKWFYTATHALHHEFTLPSPLTTLYTSTIEMIVLNQMSITVAPWLLNMSQEETILWAIFACTSVMLDHSGLKFEYTRTRDDKDGTQLIFAIDRFVNHDKHHLYYNVNYGPLGLCDFLFGTRA